MENRAYAYTSSSSQKELTDYYYNSSSNNNKNNKHSNSGSSICGIHRMYTTPSPVIFPSSSPTPKLYSAPSRKVPHPLTSWQQQQQQQETVLVPPSDEYRRYMNNESPVLSILSSTTITSASEEEEDEEEQTLSCSSASITENPLPISNSSRNNSRFSINTTVVVGSPFVPISVHDPIEERRHHPS